MYELGEVVPTLRRMRLRVLGSSGTYPMPGYPASGYLVDHEGTVVLLDAGPGTLPALQSVMDPALLDAIVLTHIHGDHSIDFFPLFNVLRFGPTEVRGMPVFAPPGAAERIAAFIGAGPDHDLFRVVEFREAAGGGCQGIGSTRISFGDAVHPVPAVAVRLDGGGRSLTYSGDTGPGGDLEELAAGTGLLLCEATTQGEPGPDTYPFHLSAGQAGTVAANAGVERLLVTHLAPGLDPDVSVSEAAAVFGGPTAWAAPGMEVVL